jgi:hypothetical protein
MLQFSGTNYPARAIFKGMKMPLLLIVPLAGEGMLVLVLVLVRRGRGKHHGRILIT